MDWFDHWRFLCDRGWRFEEEEGWQFCFQGFGWSSRGLFQGWPTVLGSDEKDVEAESVFKAAGAEIRSDDASVRRGLVTVASPLAKRIALSALTLRVASLPALTLTLASRLAGNWVSVTLFRRCLSAIVDSFFALASQKGDSLVELDRKTAEELVLLSVFAPLASANVAAGYSPKIYASDSSSSKGAFMEAFVREDVVRALWQAGDKKGSYTKLQEPFAACLAGLGEESLEEKEAFGQEVSEAPFKAPLLRFDFVEIFGGAGVVSKAASELGLVVAPCLDLSDSAHYDLRGVRLLEWCIYMIEEDRFGAYLLEPFSPAAHPAVRSYEQPLGYDRQNPKTLHGNILAFRSFVLLKVGHRKKKPCGLEQPRLSKMAWTEFWASLLGLGFKESIMASCQFGSIHRKEFRFLLYLLDAEGLETRCPGGHPHVKIEGKYTKGSAVYVEALGRHLAKGFADALRRRRALDDESFNVDGFESVVSHDIVVASNWKVRRSWHWRAPRHINVLEVSASVEALEESAITQADCREILLVDSKVAQGALTKGRSSAFSLQPPLKRACAVQIAHGLFPSWGFAPTRLNVADDPTRDVEPRCPWERSLLGGLDLVELASMHSRGLRRFASNWIRLVLLSLLPARASAGVQPTECPRFVYVFHGLWWTSMDFGLFGFQSGPFGLWKAFGIFAWALAILLLVSLCVLSCCFASLLLSWILISFDSKTMVFPKTLRLVGCFLFVTSHPASAAMEPTSAAERLRASARNQVQLPADRVVRKETRVRRAQLFERFRRWLWTEKRVSLRNLLSQKPVDAEAISGWLVAYGREMYSAGKAYGQFAETINSVSMMKPLIKRQLTPAWDLCFAWLADEPFSHHPAMPASVLLGMLSVALMWGWPLVAGVLGLTWAGVLRIGEVLQASRSNLILPGDGAPEDKFALLQIYAPKTRGHGAKHQAARVDQEDIVRLLVIAFGGLGPCESLWPFSAATLRKRFTSLLKALSLPTEKTKEMKPFDLGSLRPGGATWMLNRTENSELVRRRGRWISHRVMEVYLQEVQVATYLHKLDPAQRTRILDFASGFEDILVLAENFVALSIPPPTWFYLMKAQRAAAECGGWCLWSARETSTDWYRISRHSMWKMRSAWH